MLYLLQCENLTEWKDCKAKKAFLSGKMNDGFSGAGMYYGMRIIGRIVDDSTGSQKLNKIHSFNIHSRFSSTSLSTMTDFLTNVFDIFSCNVISVQL